MLQIQGSESTSCEDESDFHFHNDDVRCVRADAYSDGSQGWNVMAHTPEQNPGSRKQTPGSRKQTSGSRKRTPGSRRETPGSPGKTPGEYLEKQNSFWSVYNYKYRKWQNVYWVVNKSKAAAFNP
jgi:hypothetical protein